MSACEPGRKAPCLFVLLCFLTGCDLPGKPDPADRPVRADQVMDFAILYRQNCSGCHGNDGKNGPAPPLNDPLFRSLVPEDELIDIVTNGRKQTLMPAFAKESGGVLTARQIQVLVKEIKGDVVGSAPKWGLLATPPKDVPPYREQRKDPDAGSKEKGAIVFARACAVCHGERGQGVEQGSEMVNAINDRVFLALISDQAIRRYTITGRPDLGMPGYADARPGQSGFTPLTEAEVADLVALLASWRGEK